MSIRHWPIHRYALLILSLLITHPSGESTLVRNPYNDFLQFVKQYAPHWNPEINQDEIKQYAFSTWEGCNGDIDKAKGYFYVCAQETNLHCLDNRSGFGYSGATWPVIVKSLKKAHIKFKIYGFWYYAEHHPYVINRLNAEYYWGTFIHGSPKRWHNSDSEDENDHYIDSIRQIQLYCSYENRLVLAESKIWR